jgi:hypothetical protein
MARLPDPLAKLETRFQIKPRYTEAEIEAARENVARMLDRALVYLANGGEPNCPFHHSLLRYPEDPLRGVAEMLEERKHQLAGAH